jgi:ABC-type antimicrobial peptide transport system permease subunit
LHVGDALLIRVEKASLVPINAPFSPETQSSVSFRLSIAAIADDKRLGRFSLKSNQIEPFTVFINREILAEKLELAGLANFILMGENREKDLTSEKITSVFAELWKPLDAGLLVKELPENSKYELVSNRIFIDKPVSEEIEKLGLAHENVLTYLVNSFHTKSKSTPYSFIAALPAGMLPGEFKPDDIAVNEWLAEDLGIKPGDSLSLDYFVIGPLRKLNEKSSNFRVSAVIPTRGGIADSTMMPDFPGLSDAGSCRDWNTGIPIDLKRIRDKDEQYWDKYRGTPKALISLPTGKDMWSNLFGEYTSVRFQKSIITPDSLLSLIMRNVHPEQLGMFVLPVYSEGLSSASNAVDFGQLFLGLSFFIIAAGLLLIILIFALSTMSRSTETALLSGLGLSPRLILKIRVAEYFVVVLLGSIFGAFAGILYNQILVKALNTVWQGAVQTNMLEIHIQPLSLISGAGIGFLMAFVTIILISKKKLKEQVAGALKGNLHLTDAKKKSSLKRDTYFAAAGILSAVLLTLYSLFSGAYEDPGLFLFAGVLFLTGSVFGFSAWLEKVQQTKEYSSIGVFLFSLKNAGRNKTRSITVVMVLAIGVYSIVLTGAYRKTYSGAENDRKSGTGGYLFWAETSFPIPADLNNPEVQNKYLAGNLLSSDHIHFEQFHSLEGDDASCLNLNQVNRPRILGVHTEAFAKRDAFSFTSTTNKQIKTNPWQELKKAPGMNIIYAFADQSVIQYGLKKSIGDTLFYKDEAGEKIKIVLIGGLENSVFQGSLLIDDEQFVSHFPSSGGSRVMLIEAPLREEVKLAELLNRSFADYGIELTTASSRLASFNAVENTYLSVFMILGGLGLLIGTLGLGIVIFRNALERKHEYALLSAVGFKDKQIMKLILAENLFLFISGLLCGTFAAFISILPSWISPAFHTQTLPILIILTLLIFTGFITIWISSRRALSGNIIEALRSD